METELTLTCIGRKDAGKDLMIIRIDCSPDDVDEVGTLIQTNDQPTQGYTVGPWYGRVEISRAAIEYAPPPGAGGQNLQIVGYIVEAVVGAGGITALLKALTAFFRRHEGKRIKIVGPNGRLELQGYSSVDAQSLFQASGIKGMRMEAVGRELEIEASADDRSDP